MNFLALLGWSYDDKTTIMSRHELVERFSLERVVPSPATFDYEKLDWLNGVYLRALQPEEYAHFLGAGSASRGSTGRGERVSRDGAARAGEDREVLAVPRLRPLPVRGRRAAGRRRRPASSPLRPSARAASSRGRRRRSRRRCARSRTSWGRSRAGVRADPARGHRLEGLAGAVREPRAARPRRVAAAAQGRGRLSGRGGASGSSARWKMRQAASRNCRVGRGSSRRDRRRMRGAICHLLIWKRGCAARSYGGRRAPSRRPRASRRPRPARAPSVAPATNASAPTSASRNATSGRARPSSRLAERLAGARRGRPASRSRASRTRKSAPRHSAAAARPPPRPGPSSASATSRGRVARARRARAASSACAVSAPGGGARPKACSLARWSAYWSRASRASAARRRAARVRRRSGRGARACARAPSRARRSPRVPLRRRRVSAPQWSLEHRRSLVPSRRRMQAQTPTCARRRGRRGASSARAGQPRARGLRGRGGGDARRGGGGARGGAPDVVLLDLHLGGRETRACSRAAGGRHPGRARDRLGRRRRVPRRGRRGAREAVRARRPSSTVARRAR